MVTFFLPLLPHPPRSSTDLVGELINSVTILSMAQEGGESLNLAWVQIGAMLGQ